MKDPSAPHHSQARGGPLQRGRWSAKLAANVARDRRTDTTLTASGWRVLRFWEHEPPDAVVEAICAALGRPPSAPAGPRPDPAGQVTFRPAASHEASCSM